MKHTSLLIALFIFLALSGLSQAPPVIIHNGFLKAEDFTHMDERRQRDYSIGLIEGMMLAPLFGAPSDGSLKRLLDCTVGMSDSQIAAIFAKFAKDHPERWNENLHTVAYAAIMDGCSKK